MLAFFSQPSSRFMRALLALPELCFVLLCGGVYLGTRAFIPTTWHESLGWQIHPYQVFVVCTGLAVFMLPGAMLVRLLRIEADWLIRIPTYLAVAVGIWAFPSMLVAATARFDVHFLVWTGLGMMFLITLAAYIRELNCPTKNRIELGERMNSGLLILCGVCLLIMGFVSFRSPVSFDDNLQIMYVQDNLVVPHINAEEPVFGKGFLPQTRGSLTTWVLNLTSITFLSGLAPQQAFWLLKTPLALINLMALYTLSYQLFKKRNQALFTAILFFILTLVFTDGTDALGYNLYASGAQDKFVARFTLLPIALAWSISYLKEPNLRGYFLAGVCSLGLATTHPIGILLLGIPLSGLFLLHFINHLQLRSPRSDEPFRDRIQAMINQNWSIFRPYILISFVLILGVSVPLIQRISPHAPGVPYSINEIDNPILSTWINNAVTNNRLVIIDPDKNEFILNPQIFLSPPLILPIIMLPFIWWKARKRLASELIIGSFLLTLVMLLYQPAVQLVSQATTPWLLYRLTWPLTLIGPISIAWIGWEILERVSREASSSTFGTALPALSVILIAIALSGRIHLGIANLAKERAYSKASYCRTYQSVLSRLPDLVRTGAVVLATPDINKCIPASAAFAYPVEYFEEWTLNRFPRAYSSEAEQRLADVNTFTFSKVVDREWMEILSRWNVSYILLREDHPVQKQMRLLPQFFRLEFCADMYCIYQVTIEKDPVGANQSIHKFKQVKGARLETLTG